MNNSGSLNKEMRHELTDRQQANGYRLNYRGLNSGIRIYLFAIAFRLALGFVPSLIQRVLGSPS
jgi:hypothetical protein